MKQVAGFERGWSFLSGSRVRGFGCRSVAEFEKIQLPPQICRLRSVRLSKFLG